MNHPEAIVLALNSELMQYLEPITHHNAIHYYGHNDGIHRIIWILQKPKEELTGQTILVTLSNTNYASKRMTLPAHAGKPHLIIRMIGVANAQHEPADPDRVLTCAQRSEAVGRKPVTQNSTTIKAVVSEDIVEVFKALGNGNLSQGVRVAGQWFAQKLKKSPPSSSSLLLLLFPSIALL